MDTVYGFIFKSEDEKGLTDYKDIIRSMQTPIMYTDDSTSLIREYNVLLSKAFPDVEEGGVTKKFVDTADYDVWFEGLVKLFISPDTFINNKEYLNYFMSNITLNDDGWFEYIFNNQFKFIIATTAKAWKLVYPNPYKYYVVYDESQNVENDEMLALMAELCNNIGKDNPYTNVRQWNYIDTGVKISFYIFYSGSYPSDMICRELVRTYLINKYGREETERRFPKLFIVSERKIYTLYDNEILPINYEMLVDYVNHYNILSPEIVHVLDYISPLIVENGLSDIYPNYESVEGNNVLNNTFLFYISSVLNYYNGKKLSRRFIEESCFEEHDEYCSVETSGIKWLIMKFSYTGYYLDD